MSIDKKIKRYQDDINEINALLDSKKTSDFENHQAALEWYQHLCNKRKIKKFSIERLKNLQKNPSTQNNDGSFIFKK